MPKRVLAIGLDPAFADYTTMSNLTPDVVRAYLQQQLDLVRSAGYDVVDCLVDTGKTAESTLADTLRDRRFDCVVFGAGIRGPELLTLFEKLLNQVHEALPKARICFNAHPADTLAAVQRWV